jgi:hypothetical protein
MAAEDGMRTPDDRLQGERALPAGGARSSRADAPEPARDPRPRAGLLGGLREWLTLSAALRSARAQVRVRDAAGEELRRRARSACELADRVADPVEPLRAGSGDAHAIDLYRQATYWSLRALHPGASAPAALWSAAEQLARWALPNDDAREAMRALLLGMSFVEVAESSGATRQALLRDARTLAYAALEAVDGAERMVQRLRLLRLLRGATLACAVLAAAGLVFWSVRPPPRPDLAAGKPWRASSTWAVCEPAARRCGGLLSNIFFHTREDASPWVEFDLRKPTRFSAVTVHNRTDDAPDRAIPLVIEASDDAKTWRKITRRNDSFRTWTVHFKPVTARYVRLRVDRRSYLHLEKVMIHP